MRDDEASVERRSVRLEAQGIPLFWTPEGRVALVVRCHQAHIADRETFEDVGGCPYCRYTPGERQAALQARDSLLRRQKREAAEKQSQEISP